MERVPKRRILRRRRDKKGARNMRLYIRVETKGEERIREEEREKKRKRGKGGEG